MSIFEKALNLVNRALGPPPAENPLRPPSGREPRAGADRGQDALRGSAARSGSPDRSVESSPSRISHTGLTWRGSLGQTDPYSMWRVRWLNELARRLSQESGQPAIEPALADADKRKATQLLMATIFNLLEKLASELNELISFAPHRITVTEPIEVKEPVGDSQIRDSREVVGYLRLRASSSTWSLSSRGQDGVLEFFLIPSQELMALSKAETSLRLKVRMRLDHDDSEQFWTIDGFPLDPNELKVVVRNLFKELVLATLKDSEPDTLDLLANLEGEQLTRAIHQLVMEKQNLVQKIVNQNEEIQNNIARDLHDAVIADVMMLKRSLTGDRRLSDQEVVKVLDKITQQLREICHDLSPRDLKDWGLQTVIEDLLQRVSERTGTDCLLNCDSELPDLPNAVQLHIFRIVQECLNNIEKYAQASRITINIEVEDEVFLLTVKDNGRGFQVGQTGSRRGREGGRGMGSLNERAELIRCFYPTEISVQSEPNMGSTTTLRITLTGAFGQS